MPDEERAIDLANKAVRVTHGAARATDIPPYMRETGTWLGEFGALFTTLMSFLNSAYNRMWTARMRAARLLGGGGGKGPPLPPDGIDASSSAGDAPGSSRADDAKWLANYALFFIALPAAWYAIRQKATHGRSNILEDLLLGLAENTIGTMPGGRELVQILENLNNPRNIRTDNTAEDVLKSGAMTLHNAWIASEHLFHKDMAHQVDKHWLMDLANTVSYLPGPVKIPGQFVQAEQYLIARKRNQSAGAVARGLMTGKVNP